MSILKETERLLRLQNEIEAACKRITAEATSRLVAEINRILQASLDPYKGVKPEEAVPPSDQKPRSILTIADAAKETSMSEGYIKAGIRSGELISLKFGRMTRIRRADLESYIAGKLHAKTTE